MKLVVRGNTHGQPNSRASGTIANVARFGDSKQIVYQRTQRLSDFQPYFGIDVRRFT